ncbi:hypothetical protein AOR13_2872 [Alteromonas stellipolaris LMG 21856]|nr:hypothetical protein AOR13_2872 [Alteromonas stellipolaris LMG 21856]
MLITGIVSVLDAVKMPQILNVRIGIQLTQMELNVVWNLYRHRG